MKPKRKIVFFVALMSLLYCVTLMQDTYAKYLTSTSAIADLTIARWSILINNQDVVNNSDFSETISPVFSGNTNIKDDVIAPTAQGYFIVTLNGENTDVSFTYTISIDTSDCEIEDLEITKYAIGQTEYNYSGQDITGNVLLTDVDKTRTITFYVRWKDGTGETMNNAADTAVTDELTASFDINVNLVQLQ